MTLLRTTLAALLLAAPATAQHVGECDTWQANARNLAWPATEAVRSFADGSIRLIALDTGEPAVAWAHLMVTWAPVEGPGAFCALISADPDGFGFAGMTLPDIRSQQVSDIHTAFTLPIQRHDTATGVNSDALLSFTLDRDMNVIALD